MMAAPSKYIFESISDLLLIFEKVYKDSLDYLTH